MQVKNKKNILHRFGPCRILFYVRNQPIGLYLFSEGNVRINFSKEERNFGKVGFKKWRNIAASPLVQFVESKSQIL